MLNYEWTLKDAEFAKDKGKVFSCFSCGGGSTMGYKLAGFDVIGCNEIDPRMMSAYVKNHNPKYSYLEPIQEFKNRADLPAELYNLDILDGSPPCSSFSTVGNRDKDWGKKKKFKEGQSEQVLDTLFFDFVDLAAKLQPKVVIAENVKGLLLGDARNYVAKIYDEFDKAGYYCQHWLLNASFMGVPQRRERVFFVCMRKDIAVYFLQQINLFESAPLLKLDFAEKPICYGEIKRGLGKRASDLYYSRWQKRQESDKDFGDITKRENGSGSCYSDVFAKKDMPLPTIVSSSKIYDFDEGHFISDESLMLGGSWPLDYDFCGNKTAYLVGMSVPPLMTAKIAEQIHKQWLSRIGE